MDASAADTNVLLTNGGAADARFRVGTLRRTGGGLEFTLTVTRGVPLGRYPLLLQGRKVRAEPLILEVSL